MKGSSFLLLAAILTAKVAGRPHARFNDVKRDYVTDVSFATVTIADVYVYVDEDGVAYSTETVEYLTTSAVTQIATATPVQASSPDSAVAAVLTSPAIASTPDNTSGPSDAASPSPPVPQADTPFSSPAPVVVPSSSIAYSPTQVAAAAVQSSAAPQVSAVASDQFPVGVAWDAFTGTSGSTSCKSADQVKDEFNSMKAYKVVRLYGTGCNQVPLAVQNAKSNDQQLILGMYLNTENVGDDVKTFSDAINSYAGGDWNVVAMVTVENEQVNNKAMTASDVVDAIDQARSALKAVGYTGPVAAVETAPAMIDNPSICQASDYAVVNIHAFFDSNTVASDAGSFVKDQVAQVQQACNGKRVIVSESGWPYQGDTNGKAVPSKQNQQAAISSLHSAFPQDIILFSPFDSSWKTNNAGTFNAEQYWGFM